MPCAEDHLEYSAIMPSLHDSESSCSGMLAWRLSRSLSSHWRYPPGSSYRQWTSDMTSDTRPRERVCGSLDNYLHAVFIACKRKNIHWACALNSQEPAPDPHSWPALQTSWCAWHRTCPPAPPVWSPAHPNWKRTRCLAITSGLGIGWAKYHSRRIAPVRAVSTSHAPFFLSKPSESVISQLTIRYSRRTEKGSLTQSRRQSLLLWCQSPDAASSLASTSTSNIDVQSGHSQLPG